MKQTRLPSRAAMRRLTCVTASGGGWLVSRLPPEAPDPAAEPLPLTAYPGERVPRGSLKPEGSAGDRGCEILIAADPAEGDPGAPDPLAAFPYRIRTEEAEAVRAYASRLADPAGRTVLVLHAADSGITLWDVSGGQKHSSPLGLSLIDRMILRANTRPGEWGGSSGALQLPPGADTDALLAQCASLRRRYSDAEREGLTDAAITAETPFGTLRVSLEMMCALLEEPDPWILGEHLDRKELAALSPEERGQSWAGAVSAFLRGVKGRTASPAGSPVLILAGEAARMELLRALAAACFEGFRLIPDPSGADPAHAGLCLLAADLTEAALRRETVLRLCEWLESAEAHKLFQPMLAQAFRNVLSMLIDFFQNVWKKELERWAAQEVSGTSKRICCAGMEYRNGIEPKAPALVKKELLEGLNRLCGDALVRLAGETGCALTPAHAESIAVHGAIERKAAEAPEMSRTTRGLSWFLYRRMVLYHCTVTGSNEPDVSVTLFNFFLNTRPQSRQYIAAVSDTHLKDMKLSDLAAWETAPERSGLTSAADLLLMDLPRRIDAALTQQTTIG